MTSSDKISRLLKEKGWTLAHLRRLCNLKPRHMAYVVAGEREPKVSTAVRIAEALNVSVHWLYDDGKDWEDREPISSGPLEAVSDYELLNILLQRSMGAARGLEQAIKRLIALSKNREGIPPEVFAQFTEHFGQCAELGLRCNRAATGLLTIAEHLISEAERADEMLGTRHAKRLKRSLTFSGGKTMSEASRTKIRESQKKRWSAKKKGVK